MLLVACASGHGAAGRNPAPAPTPGTTPTPDPAVALTFTGDGYTIGYPRAWQLSALSGVEFFSDPATLAVQYFQVRQASTATLAGESGTQAGRMFKGRTACERGPGR